MSRDSILSIQNLNHSLGRRSLHQQVLFNINLEIYTGEIILLTGPSGAGKTTLLTLIGGLRSVQSGNLRFLHWELAGASTQQLVRIRRHIGYIFQSHNLLEFLTAHENVQMAVQMNPLISYHQARRRAEVMLQLVKLGDRLNYFPHQLSGGQKQRVAIARALVNQPPLVLADEPTSALDSKTGRDIIEMIQRLAKEQGCTILMVTHDHRILDVADRILHMEDGCLYESTTGSQNTNQGLVK